MATKLKNVKNNSVPRSLFSPAEELESRLLFSTYMVTNNNDAGAGSLRQAILDSNAHGGADTIDFNISGGATIYLDSQLDNITDALTIDGASQAGYAGQPLVAIDGTLAGSSDGLVFQAANVHVKGLAIENFEGSGVVMAGGNGSVAGCYIGTDTTGSFAQGNSTGVMVISDNNSITSSLISGNSTQGIYITGSHNTVQGDLVGTDASGLYSVQNERGITVDEADHTQIGGNSASLRNIISGNNEDGIAFTNITGAGNVVQGNYIGVDITGEGALGNVGNGVDLGTLDMDSVSNVLVGGSNAGEGNVISGNFGNGVLVENSSFNTIAGNIIGLDASGTIANDVNWNAFGNSASGINVGFASHDNMIGGSSAGARNIISNNFGNGIKISTNDTSDDNNTIQGNYIGADITGEITQGNLGNGIVSLSPGTLITGNLISGNDGDGIVLDSDDSVSGNMIGTGADGSTNLGNGGDGVFVTGDNNLISSNIIAQNGGNGVTISSGVSNKISANSIFANQLLGIDLGNDGATVNDSAGHVGPNNFQNFPILGSASISGSSLTISGALQASANSTYVVELFSSADENFEGQGHSYLGFVTVTTDASGSATFSKTVAAVSGETFISATATDTAGNTSEFSSDLSANVIVQASTSTTLASSSNPSTNGQLVTFTATVSSNAAGTITGNVMFYDGSTLLGSGSISNGQATFSTSSLSVSSHAITAVYGGDSNYLASTSGPLTQIVNAAATSTTISSNLNPSINGQLVTFTAAVNSAVSGTITGNVLFYDGNTLLGSGSLSGGQATYSTAALSVANHTITAVYVGDTNYATSTSAPITQSVNVAPTTTTLSSSANPSSSGQLVTFTATVSSTLSRTITGSVFFYDGNTLLGSGSISGGQATFSTSSLSAGNHPITAVYSGDANYDVSTSDPLIQSVGLAGTTTTISSSSNPSTIGQLVTFTATISSSTAGTLSGNVLFYDGITLLGSGAVSNGQATFSTSALSVSTHTITAVYSGDASYSSSTSGPLSQVVNKAASSTTVSSNTNPATKGQLITFTATVTPGATGAVQFLDGSTLMGSGTISNGHATFSTSALSVATHSITAVYGGDATYNPSTSSPLSQVVNKAASSTTVSSNANPSSKGQLVTFTATVTAGATGSVQFFDGTTLLGTATISAGHATLSTSALSVGNHTITASYGGDSSYNASTSAPLAQVVNKASSTTTVTSNANPSTQGQLVTLTAIVATADSGAAGGTISFYDGTTFLGSASVSSNKATFSTSALSVATHSITAVYSGDANYSTSTGALSQVVKSAANSVAGHTYNDVTGNGLSGDDTLLSNVTVTLYKDSNNNGSLDSHDQLIATMTTVNGAYSFGNLANGRYFVQETSPCNTVLTAPVLGSYYTYVATGGTTTSTDDFDNYALCDTCSVTNIVYTVNGKCYTDLRGHCKQGDTVKVSFTIPRGKSVTLTLVSYTAPDPTFVAADASKQDIYALATGSFGPGTYTLTVQVPSCYFQVDFVCGQAINTFGPAGSNIFYSAQDRLFSADNGGTTPPVWS